MTRPQQRGHNFQFEDQQSYQMKILLLNQSL